MSTALRTEPTGEKRDRRRRGVVFLKFGLAGAALLGIAAAATSASWSDNAWFSASAQAATVKLSASSSGTSGSFTYADTGNGGTAITFGASDFGELNQGASKPVTLYLRNDGSVPLTVSAVTTSGTGGIFTADTSVTGTAGNPAAVVSDLATGTSIAPGATASFTVTLTTPLDWESSFQGKTGTVAVHVSVSS